MYLSGQSSKCLVNIHSKACPHEHLISECPKQSWFSVVWHPCCWTVFYFCVCGGMFWSVNPWWVVWIAHLDLDSGPWFLRVQVGTPSKTETTDSGHRPSWKEAPNHQLTWEVHKKVDYSSTNHVTRKGTNSNQHARAWAIFLILDIRTSGSV